MRWDRLHAGRLREELEKANGELHLIFSFLAMLSVPAYVKDKTGRLLYLNNRAEQLWKVKAGDAIGKTVSLVVGSRQLEKETRASDQKVLQRVASHVFFHGERDPHSYSFLQFPIRDTEGDRVIAGLVVEHDA